MSTLIDLSTLRRAKVLGMLSGLTPADLEEATDEEKRNAISLIPLVDLVNTLASIKPGDDVDVGGYLPTREVIAFECRQIQRGWTSDQRRQRAGIPYGGNPWTVPTANVHSEF